MRIKEADLLKEFSTIKLNIIGLHALLYGKQENGKSIEEDISNAKDYLLQSSGRLTTLIITKGSQGVSFI